MMAQHRSEVSSTGDRVDDRPRQPAEGDGAGGVQSRRNNSALITAIAHPLNALLRAHRCTVRRYAAQVKGMSA